MTLSNVPSHIDRGRGGLSQRGRNRHGGPSSAGATASTTARLIHADLLRSNERRHDTEVSVLGKERQQLVDEQCT